jgi:hypothetical protein
MTHVQQQEYLKNNRRTIEKLNSIDLLIAACWVLFVSLPFWALTIVHKRLIDNIKQRKIILYQMTCNHRGSIGKSFLYMNNNDWISLRSPLLFLLFLYHRVSHRNVVEQQTTNQSIWLNRKMAAVIKVLKIMQLKWHQVSIARASIHWMIF